MDDLANFQDLDRRAAEVLRRRYLLSDAYKDHNGLAGCFMGFLQEFYHM